MTPPSVLYPEVTGDLVRFQSGTSEWRQQFDFISDESGALRRLDTSGRTAMSIFANADEVIQYGPSVSERFRSRPRLSATAWPRRIFESLLRLDLCLASSTAYTYSNDASHLGTAVMTKIPDVKDEIARSSAASTYRQILGDLETALEMFSDGWSKGCFYASPAACKALMATVISPWGTMETHSNVLPK